ncbi:hypothetical protein Trisim1_012437 [Trichoderma cf. simile WF8]
MFFLDSRLCRRKLSMIFFIGFDGFPPDEMQLFVSRQTDDCYMEILTELQLRILTCIYFLQRDWPVEAEPHKDRAIDLLVKYKERFHQESHGQFRMAHLAFRYVCRQYTLEYPKELAPWKQVKDILGNGFNLCLQFLPQELIQSIEQCMEITILEQRKNDLEVGFLSQTHQLSTREIRRRLYKELHLTTFRKDVRFAFPGSSVNRISKLSKLGAEIELLWPILNKATISVNIKREISNIADLIGRLFVYIMRSQSGSVPDRMQSFGKECAYLLHILKIYYRAGPSTFQSTARRSQFTSTRSQPIYAVARMVYTMTEFVHFKPSLSTPSEIYTMWRAICRWYGLSYLDFGSLYHMTTITIDGWLDYWATGIDPTPSDTMKRANGISVGPFQPIREGTPAQRRSFRTGTIKPRRSNKGTTANKRSMCTQERHTISFPKKRLDI